MPQAGGPGQAAMRAGTGQLVAPHGGRLSQPAQRAERPTDRQPGEQMTLEDNASVRPHHVLAISGKFLCKETGLSVVTPP